MLIPPLLVRNTIRGNPVNYCIYCGETNSLTDEHPIPIALGGRYVLPKASCRACSDITSAFELKVTRGFMLQARAAAGFPTRRRKQRPKSFPLEVLKGKTYVTYAVPVEKFPAILSLPLLAPAGFLHKRKVHPGIELIGNEDIIFGKHAQDTVRDLGGTGIKVTYRCDFSAYVRLLAKAALGFAIATVGSIPLNEVPILPLILGKADDGSMWIGSAQFRLTVEDTNPTHAVGFNIVPNPEDPSKYLLIARLKMFANSGATGYEIVVWKPEVLPPHLFPSPRGSF